jgi:uncharacterized protein YdhG (YjbR/CyaY superfamily)
MEAPLTTDPTGPTTIDEYIAGFPPEVQEILRKIRMTIREAAPGAQEAIAYRIPTFKLHGGLLSFAAYKKHIGMYPAPVGDEKFNQALSVYSAEKSTIRFPLDKPVPYDLIRQIVELRVADNLEKAAAKAESGFLWDLSAPARRALEGKGILTLTALSRYSERQILQLHGVGPGTMPKLRQALQARGLSFKEQ